MPKPLPSQVYLQECFDYSLETGELRWRERPVSHFATEAGAKSFWKRWPGRIAGSKDRGGHLQVEIGHEPHMVQRIIWKWMTGEEPPATVDHKNHIRDDNRWDNLRLATYREQVWNRAPSKKNGARFRGVNKHGHKWRARLVMNGKTRYFSGYATPEEASAAREAAAKEAYGEFYTT